MSVNTIWRHYVAAYNDVVAYTPGAAAQQFSLLSSFLHDTSVSNQSIFNSISFISNVNFWSAASFLLMWISDILIDFQGLSLQSRTALCPTTNKCPHCSLQVDRVACLGSWSLSLTLTTILLIQCSPRVNAFMLSLRFIYYHSDLSIIPLFYLLSLCLMYYHSVWCIITLFHALTLCFCFTVWQTF